MRAYVRYAVAAGVAFGAACATGISANGFADAAMAGGLLLVAICLGGIALIARDDARRIG